MNRETVLDAIAKDLQSEMAVGADAADRSALLALVAIEALGFAVVPKTPDQLMYLHAGMSHGEARKNNPAMRRGDVFLAQWRGAIAGSPLYRSEESVDILVHAPKNAFRIAAIWAAISIDASGEGLCAVMVDGTWMPLIAADEKRLEWVVDQARALASATEKRIEVIKLTARETVAEIEPSGGAA